jgi:hypothetical protein
MSLGPEPRPFKVQKLKKYKLLDTDQIWAELIQAGAETLHTKIHKLITFISNIKEFPQQLKSLLLYPFKRRAIN